MKIDTLIKGGTIVTSTGSVPRNGKEMNDVRIIEKGYIAIDDGVIVEVAEGDPSRIEAKTTINAEGKVVTPGLVDPHTHLIHVGSRENEMALKLKGVSYLDILKSGGGILNTVRSTRSASDGAIISQILKSLRRMVKYGTTTAEVKSGYGLNTEQELRLLRLMHNLDSLQPIDIVPTFMGAHAVPEEYKNDKDAYVHLVVEDMLPKVAEEGLARYCDVFCEEGVFDIDDSRYILTKARELGLGLKIHADEINPMGGAELAAELRAVSADHLLASTDEGLMKMKEAGVIAVLLPITSFNLEEKFARARDMIEMGLAVALATDYNPGSSPTESMQFVMNMAAVKLKMTPEEIITAATLNAACAIGMGELIGTIEEGKAGDVVVFDAPNLNYIPYHLGVNLSNTVVKRGSIVYKAQE
ncbi:MAG: imidazolonepropionase [Thermoanaerobacteraceae bacterium]|nr:imidazolonepropionase [Thermoanaerobacteraceae bacterium]